MYAADCHVRTGAIAYKFLSRPAFAVDATVLAIGERDANDSVQRRAMYAFRTNASSSERSLAHSAALKEDIAHNENEST